MAPAIWAARGRIFSDRSEDSARNSCMPPIRSVGRIAIAMAMMPMPPSHCSRARHSRMPGRRGVEADDHGRAGGRDARHRLEEGVRVGKLQPGEGERERTECGGGDPDKAGQQESLTSGKSNRAPLAAHQGEIDADEQCKQRRDDEREPVRVADGDVGKGRDQHQKGQHDQKTTKKGQDRLEADDALGEAALGVEDLHQQAA